MDNSNNLPTGKYCCQLGSELVCTDNEHLAGVYADIRKILEMDNEDTAFYIFVLTDMLTEINRYLESAGLSESEMSTKIRIKAKRALEAVRTEENGLATARDLIRNSIHKLVEFDASIKKK